MEDAAGYSAPRWVTNGAFGALVIATLTRSTYPLLHGRFFAEEGYVQFARMERLQSIRGLWYINLHVGYWNFFSDLGTWLATFVPLARAPLVTGWLSWLLIVTILAVAMYVPSELLPTQFTHIAAATLLIVGTLAVPEVWLNTTNAQTYMGVLAVLLLFVNYEEIGRAPFVGLVVALAIAGLSGPYAMVLVPLFVFQLVRRRGRRQMIVTGVLALAAGIQLIAVVVAQASGNLEETRIQFPGFGVITRDVGAGHISMFLFGGGLGERLRAHAYTFEGLAAFALLATIVLGALGIALSNVPRAHVAGLLVGAFVIEETLVNFGSIHNSAGGRYSVVPIAILTLAVVHATTARAAVIATAATAVCGLVLCFGLINFWSYHPRVLRCIDCPNWTAQVEAFADGGPNKLFIWPYPRPSWHVTIPKDQRGSAAGLPSRR